MTNSFLQYLQFEKRYSPNTILAYQTDLDQLRTFLKSAFPETVIQDANHAILRDWLIELAESGLSETSINRKLVTIRMFFKFLLKRGIIAQNPAAKIFSLKVKKRLPQFVRQQDMDQVFKAEIYSPEFQIARDYLIIELLYGTGMRLSELITLKESSIDILNSTIKVLGKRNKERIIPIPQNLLSLLRNYMALKNETFKGNASDNLIVSNSGKKSYSMMINRVVKKCLQGVSTDKKNPHILRHTYATHLLERGADLNAVKDLLGHQSLAATQVYTHNTLGKLKKIFDQAHPKA